MFGDTVFWRYNIGDDLTNPIFPSFPRVNENTLKALINATLIRVILIFATLIFASLVLIRKINVANNFQVKTSANLIVIGLSPHPLPIILNGRIFPSQKFQYLASNLARISVALINAFRV